MLFQKLNESVLVNHGSVRIFNREYKSIQSIEPLQPISQEF